ncbi:DDE_3 domain-containing protein [Trichonephila clavipes]|nr:DDE_3 domain-containing protein [Trichonephila clavipes]
MNVGSSGQVMVQPRENRVSIGHFALLRRKPTVFGLRQWRIALCLWQKSELQLKPLEHNKTVTSRTGASQIPVACVPLIPNHWRFRRHSRSTLVVSASTLTTHFYVSLVIQPIVLPFMNSIQVEVFLQDNALSYTAVVTKRASQSVDMLPLPARSPDLFLIERVWDIIGLQLQHNPQPALTIPEST